MENKPDKLSIVTAILEDDIAKCKEEMSTEGDTTPAEDNIEIVQLNPDIVLEILEEVTYKGRVSFGELEQSLYPEYNGKSKEFVKKSVDILKNQRQWIDSVESPLLEHTTYYMTAAGLSAVRK